METQHSVYRVAMRHMQRALHPYAKPTVCLQCAGWRSFGGLKHHQNVTMGPICICTPHWRKLEAIVTQLNTKEVPISA